MDEEREQVGYLLARLRQQEKEIEDLKSQLAELSNQDGHSGSSKSAATEPQKWPLQQDEYRRYGRQMILQEVGLAGQLKLRDASVLIVGLGGLGCPAAAYLAGAGVGTIGLMDGDVVDMSNLHRQILHSAEKIGMLKVESAEISLRQYVRHSVNDLKPADLVRLNPFVRYKLHRYHLAPTSAVQDFSPYDLILDCTDHPMSRYLVSDAALCARIPFVSAAALRTDGQLHVLNYPPFQPEGKESHVSGPCYRCIHPKPPPPESMISCGEGGILGPVVGTMGVLMATEAIKIIVSSRSAPRASTTDSSMDRSSAPGPQPPQPPSPSMLIYSAFATPPFRSVKIRGRRKDCCACSPDPSLRTISAKTLQSGAVDYATFCGQLSTATILAPSERMEARQLAQFQREQSHRRILLLDTREETQFDICSLPGSINVPLAQVKAWANEIAKELAKEKTSCLVVVCRFGNDSQVAVKALQEALQMKSGQPWIGDLKGGLEAWRKDVDPEFPEY